MTNYEYLISNNELTSFLTAIHKLDWEVIYVDYDIPKKMTVSEWLQTEHINTCYIIQCLFVDEDIKDIGGTETYRIRKINKSRKDKFLCLCNATYNTLAEARSALAEHIRKVAKIDE